MSHCFSIIGLMSGTSLDGIDLSYCDYTYTSDQWSYSIRATKSYTYTSYWQEKLKNAIHCSALELYQLDIELADLFSETVLEFISEFKINPSEISAVASHGHTIFHQPENEFTVQIGNGERIAVKTNLIVINDFRSKDVALKGQGAPLVPIGDHHLFITYADGFLNIGGISNISFRTGTTISAFDICPGNLPLNYLIQKIGIPFDKNGEHARKGNLNLTLLNELNSLGFYSKLPPKSLGIEWIEANFFPVISKHELSLSDQLCTIVEHIAIQICKVSNEHHLQQLFITGGGAFHTYLIERIQHHFKGSIVIPSAQLIEFKEAIIFGFLGACRLLLHPNCLSSVTGSIRDNCGGVIHIPN
ncbi:MAG: anhydro-N-acetylmuramic acid kinase [Crocinitomicaceae bacterium]|nr:anhydro-N-acetylmuramic acid kinase [Crocinitomicaceae bacterium]